MKTDAAHILYYQHLAGCRICEKQADLTFKQDLFLSLMAVEDINSERMRNEELEALCKSQGIKFSRKYNRFQKGGDLRDIFRRRQRELDKNVFKQ